MAVFRKQIQAQNLHIYRTWLDDTDPQSKYFQLSQFPEVLTIGKNAFLIHGTQELVPSTELKIELLDSIGNPVYISPIKNYQEGLARLVSIEVYKDTSPGLATLTILGEAARDINGNPVPDEWKGIYNVRWQRRINISPNLVNGTPVRLYNYPTASVDELVSAYRIVNQEVINTSTPFETTIFGVPSSKIYTNDNPFIAKYTIITSDRFFTREMEGGIIRVEVNGTPYTSSITDVINSTMAQVFPGYEENSYLREFTATGMSASFSGSTGVTATPYVKSYADLTIKNLSTFSGNIFRAKLFANTPKSTADFQFIGDFELKAEEMLSTEFISTGEGKIRTGYVENQKNVDDYWVAGRISSVDEYNGVV
jgi:hypothetical protein